MNASLKLFLKALILGLIIWFIYRVYTAVKSGLGIAASVTAVLTTSPLKVLGQLASASYDTGTAIGGAAESYVGLGVATVKSWGTNFSNWLTGIF